MMRSSVIVFPGSNCDRDIAVALKKLQFKNSMVWHKETELPRSDLIVVPAVSYTHLKLPTTPYV